MGWWFGSVSPVGEFHEEVEANADDEDAEEDEHLVGAFSHYVEESVCCLGGAVFVSDAAAGVEHVF